MTSPNPRDLAWRVVCGSLFPLCPSCSGGALEAALASADTSWPDVVELSGEQLVTPGVTAALQVRGLYKLLPDEPRQYLQTVYELNQERNRRIREQLGEITDCFSAHDIDTLLLKGAAYLEAGLYADPAARILGDLDLMVAAEHIERAQALLLQLGYAKIAAGRRNFDRHHHVQPVARPGAAAVVELHRSPVHREYRAFLPTKDAWGRSRELVDGRERVHVLDPFDAATLTIVHSEINDRNVGKHVIALRAIQDLVTLQEHYSANLDWDRMAGHFRALGKQQELLNMAYKVFRTTGIELVRGLGFGRRESLHYDLCKLGIRHQIARAAFRWMDSISPGRVMSRVRRLVL